MWLTIMSTHHEGAMARTELTAGDNPDAKTSARSIITSPTAQPTQMKAARPGSPRGAGRHRLTPPTRRGRARPGAQVGVSAGCMAGMA